MLATNEELPGFSVEVDESDQALERQRKKPNKAGNFVSGYSTFEKYYYTASSVCSEVDFEHRFEMPHKILNKLG